MEWDPASVSLELSLSLLPLFTLEPGAWGEKGDPPARGTWTGGRTCRIVIVVAYSRVLDCRPPASSCSTYY